MKSVVLFGVAAVALALPAQARAQAQEVVARQVLALVCLPYAGRSASFEDTIRAARSLDFRRPAGDTAPLDPWASELDMVSNDGAWRLRIEEGQVEDVYAVTCSISSHRASARELKLSAERVLKRSASWLPDPGMDGRWVQRTPFPDEILISVKVEDAGGSTPVLTAVGAYR